MRTYKDLDYIKEHLSEIVNETTIDELKMEPDYEQTEYWFYVKTKKGEMVEIRCHLYVKWMDSWFINEVTDGTI